MRYIEPIKVKVLMIFFFATGSFGIIVGLSPIAAGQQGIMITFMGVINIGLGAFFAFLFLTQIRQEPDKRKKKRNHD
ncbi:MAG: hypothetical protein HRU07_05005 [Nitrosopumilus sp.]|nr:hypothetical protein [Nitrosopumilus sp.]NRA05511.1 hypothetical protein [Nitrosopumilus sp.]